MFQTITLLVFCASLLGLAGIILRKAPVLAEIPIQDLERGPRALSKIKSKVQSNGIVQKLSLDSLLHKFLSKFRVLTMKTENRTAHMLEKLRKKSIEKKKDFSEDYWQKIKNEE